jgi:hypothetical protein
MVGVGLEKGDPTGTAVLGVDTGICAPSSNTCCTSTANINLQPQGTALCNTTWGTTPASLYWEFPYTAAYTGDFYPSGQYPLVSSNPTGNVTTGSVVFDNEKMFEYFIGTCTTVGHGTTCP